MPILRQSRWWSRTCWALLGLCVAGHAAHAEVWGFVDAQGVPHFAVEKRDGRYELFFRGPEAQLPGLPGAAQAQLQMATSGSSMLLTYFEISPSYKSVKHLLREASNRHAIDLELLQAVIATESGFDARAVSPRGAVGLMQVTPATAQRFGVGGDTDNPVEKRLADPRTNIQAGSRYLSHLLKQFAGRLELALAAYNAGAGAVQRAGNKIPDYPETQHYVKTVMQLYALLKPVGAAMPGYGTGLRMHRAAAGVAQHIPASREPPAVPVPASHTPSEPPELY